jgi:hypothetical protein
MTYFSGQVKLYLFIFFLQRTLPKPGLSPILCFLLYFSSFFARFNLIARCEICRKYADCTGCTKNHDLESGSNRPYG